MIIRNGTHSGLLQQYWHTTNANSMAIKRACLSDTHLTEERETAKERCVGSILKTTVQEEVKLFSGKSTLAIAT